MDKIKELAYLKWEQAGKPIGRDLEFWLAAEQELSCMTKGFWVYHNDKVIETPVVIDPNTFNKRKGILTKYGKKLLEDGAKFYKRYTAGYFSDIRELCDGTNPVQKEMEEILRRELGDGTNYKGAEGTLEVSESNDN